MYIKFEIVNDVDFQEFVTYWTNLYTYYPKHQLGNKLYDDNIMKREFSEEDIYALFTWKNGMPLSGKKNETVKQITQHLNLINRLKSSEQINIHSYLDFINDGVWKIFLLHIIKPEFYPIFDQHTYRAYQYIKTGMILEIPKDKTFMMNFYLDVYVPFIHYNVFDNNNAEHRRLKIREIDKALFAFGKFLKSPYVSMLGLSLDSEFIESTMSSVYSQQINGTDDFSPLLKDYLAKNPNRLDDVNKIFKVRDFYMQNENYDKRWNMGYYLMNQFGIEFEQSEGSELIFALCLAIKDQYRIPDSKIGHLLADAISKQYVG
jgi:hypothetical protein